ncbi:hypothetical protein F5Y18DRAFT_390627 [Xylariaceae sp. FL1019]|nr:hypothetical protein F5Y18DRAFT_390627 [Xylariaceae sp. FL1019]
MTNENWASRARASKVRQDAQNQQLITVFERLLDKTTGAAEAANEILAIWNPVVRQNASDPRILRIGVLLCDIVRELGADLDTSNRLHKFLDAIGQHEIENAAGYTIKNAWGGPYWTGLPGFALTFREYGIDVEPADELTIQEWLDQKDAFLNATTFAAVGLATKSTMSGMEFYVLPCFGQTFNDDYEPPDAKSRITFFVPAASIWIMNAGERIFRLCQNGQAGFDLEAWQVWEQGFTSVAANKEVEEDVRRAAKEAAIEMQRIKIISDERR